MFDADILRAKKGCTCIYILNLPIHWATMPEIWLPSVKTYLPSTFRKKENMHDYLLKFLADQSTTINLRLVTLIPPNIKLH